MSLRFSSIPKSSGFACSLTNLQTNGWGRFWFAWAGCGFLVGCVPKWERDHPSLYVPNLQIFVISIPKLQAACGRARLPCCPSSETCRGSTIISWFRLERSIWLPPKNNVWSARTRDWLCLVYLSPTLARGRGMLALMSVYSLACNLCFHCERCSWLCTCSFRVRTNAPHASTC